MSKVSDLALPSAWSLNAALSLAAAVTVLGAAAATLAPWSFAAVAAAVVSVVLMSARQNSMPWILRPVVVLMAPVVVIGFVSGTLLPDVQSVVAKLSIVVTAGMAIGMLLAERGRDWVVSPRPRLAVGLMVVGVAAGLYFFVGAGVPLLADSVEQGRVDAAASGTGYVRLLAYMMIPASIVLICTRHRSAWLLPVCAALVVAGLANRSPILYLVTPCVLVLLNAGNRSRLQIGRYRQLAFGAAIAGMAVAVIGLGAYRIVTQPEFRTFPEYRSDIESGNYAAVGLTAFSHYARVVPSNAELAVSLIDAGELPRQYGATYASLFVTALPGHQDTLDMKLKEASGKEFVGGGIPPTLAGEGYVNFGWPGVLLGGLAMGWLAVRFSRLATVARLTAEERRAGLALYGYVIAWSVGAHVAGFSGASTFPMAGFLALCLLMRWRRASCA
ncbi:oligosaccharide repeat unit polymerase [Nocardioides euryhalodurans]|uniref:Oligosaccharide repeat unit polymerase n=1 Tax=Nocardioides euryhalodurans TaxID=2518370 RepID=A0A4P7GNP4_9ACTN|nr:oligosaccharide repeat unit polymerase [Nocardioides euryhalodurans]QBR93391.1 oligosaccharide repeat unit polymerase [Nocardioides euryhalodurans]